jgi:molybdenum cofactor cytidylyltransferase
MEKSNNLAVLILAAGTSSRLGEAKQLLKVGNETLIQIAVKKALKISSKVRVVLGHKSDEILNEIIDFPISICVNPNYKEGMGRSISYGMSDFFKSQKVLLVWYGSLYRNNGRPIRINNILRKNISKKQ